MRLAGTEGRADADRNREAVVLLLQVTWAGGDGVRIYADGEAAIRLVDSGVIASEGRRTSACRQ